MNKLFLFFLVFVGMQSECMELSLVRQSTQQHPKLTEDIVCHVIRSYLSLQSLARFGSTCKTYEKIFEPGKIEYYALGLREVRDNYYRCTQALGRCAQYENSVLFKRLWRRDGAIRDYNIAKLEQKLHLTLGDKMNAYRKYYSNFQDVDNNITKDLRSAIMNKENLLIGRIVQSKKYNIFELFNNETLEAAFQTLCSIKDFFIGVDNILALLPVENGEYKNRAVQYIAKYDEFNVLIQALEKGYLKADEEYGYECTALHYAALRGCRALTDRLLKKGADVHAVNKWGKQPLYYAERFNQEHHNFGHLYAYRGNGVEDLLNAYCYRKHGCLLKITQQCGSSYKSWDISQEEAAWLRNSCTYSLKESDII